MPHLKFTRDRRGYESTFLVHTARRRGREHPVVLYWFRTPPHVKVGRAAIDEDAIRALEHQHPDIVFDWDRILEAKPPAAAEPEDGPGWRARRDRDRRSESRGDRPRSGPERRVETPPPAETQVVETEPSTLSTAEVSDSGGAVDVDAEAVWESSTELSSRSVPSADSLSAAEQALGSLGLSKLRGRYAEVMARVHAAPLDQAARDKIAERAELLNPDSWVTADDVTQGLDKFEQVLAEVVQQVGTPRRRTRRGGRRNRRRRERMVGAQSPGASGPEVTTAAAGVSGAPEDAADDGDESDDDSSENDPEPTA